MTRSQQIGEEISEKLDYTPSSLFVRRIVRPKYVVRFPDRDQPDELRIAELPPEVLPRSKAAPGLVADVIVSKLVDHLPLYRQEQRYARQGFPIARSTLCRWLAEAADVLTPLWQALKERVLAADIVNTDDTPVPVQDPARDHCRTGRIWAYVSQHGTIYDATPDRSRDGPLAFLQDFRGYLQCDAYAGRRGGRADGPGCLSVRPKRRPNLARFKDGPKTRNPRRRIFEPHVGRRKSSRGKEKAV